MDRLTREYAQRRMDAAIAKVRVALKPDKLKVFDNLSRQQQEEFVLKAIDRGVLKWTIGANTGEGS